MVGNNVERINLTGLTSLTSSYTQYLYRENEWD